MGQFIDVSMVDCLISLMLDEPLDCYEQLGLPLRQGNRIMRFSPFNTYPTADGMVAIGAANEADWKGLLAVMGRDDLLADTNFMNTGWRIANNAAVDEVVAGWTRTRNTADIVDDLAAREIPCSPIRDIGDVAAWPHLAERGLLQTLTHPGFPQLQGPLAPAFPLKFSGAFAGYDRPAPMPRQHNDEIYRDLLGLTDSEIEHLSAAGAI